jgi:5-methyltetrahydrofolate--homocysteine methyltransferase
MDAEKAAGGGSSKGRMVIATVKGDVHDIGKNIVAVVLRCNGYEVTDLGVMCPMQKILDTAIELGVDMVGLSGLITPSLDEMITVAKEMERRAMTMPLLIGGATTSGKHTAVKIAQSYSGPTVHVADASLAVGVVGKLLGSEKATFVDAVREKQAQVREAHASSLGRRPLLSLADARARRARLDFSELAQPDFIGVRPVEVAIGDLVPWIDWSPFFHAWELSGRYPKILDDPDKGEAARNLFAEGKELLDRIVRDRSLTARGAFGFFPAISEGDDLVIFADEARRHEHVRIPMLRQQEDKEICYSLADFVAPAGHRDHVGGFVVTAGIGQDELVAAFEADHDDYRSIMVKSLADRLAEAFAEYLHKQARDHWGYGRAETLSMPEIIDETYRGIRPAFGYPACPDHLPKTALFELLDHADHHTVRLTESMAMLPTASVSGLYFGHPDSKYFSVGRVGRDQVDDYARRMGLSVAAIERMIPSNLAY